MVKLDGKGAFVTGGGRGIGRAIAEGYVQEGCVVVTAATSGNRSILLSLSGDGTKP